ncbi:MAG: hypothetical protein II625_01410 [Bacilli bacterium]|nr:hypothetical protein [Bacilli bacterium]
MENNDQRRAAVYKFFKDKLNLDFNEFSPQKARMVVDELNKRLDDQLAVEREKNKKLTQEIYTERNRLMELTQEVYG